MARRPKGLRARGPYGPDARGRYRVELAGPGARARLAASTGGRAGGQGGPAAAAADAPAIYHLTSKTAAEELRKRLDDLVAKVLGRTLEQAITGFLADLRAQELDETTVDDGEVRLRMLERAGVTHVDELRRRHVEALLAGEYSKRRPGMRRSVATRRGHLKWMRRFFEWAREEGLLRHDPTAGVKVKGRARRGKPQLTLVELHVLDLVCALDPSPEALAVHVLIWTGIRSEELRSLRWRDLSLRTEPAQLVVDESKTEAGRRRVVELPEVIGARLRSMGEGKALEDLVWPARLRGGRIGPHGRHWLIDHTRALCRKAKVREVTPHGLRGTTTTSAHEAGLPLRAIAALLGHANERVTLDSYSQADRRLVSLEAWRRRLEEERAAVEETAPDAAEESGE